MFARRKALFARSRSTREVQVDRHVRSTGGGVRIAFTAPLDRAARAALRRNGRLLTTLRLTITPEDGAPYTAKRVVILRRPHRARHDTNPRQSLSARTTEPTRPRSGIADRSGAMYDDR